MFVIDGNNLMWSAGDCPEAAGPDSDYQLCRLIGRYLDSIGEMGQVIFDGTEPDDGSRFDRIPNVEVLFAGVGKDADTVIEEKLKASTAPRGLTVVSSDRRLRKAAQAKKAAAIKSEVFWGNVKRVLSRKDEPREPKGKREGLTHGETEHWLDVFGLDQ